MFLFDDSLGPTSNFEKMFCAHIGNYTLIVMWEILMPKSGYAMKKVAGCERSGLQCKRLRIWRMKSMNKLPLSDPRKPFYIIAKLKKKIMCELIEFNGVTQKSDLCITYRTVMDNLISSCKFWTILYRVSSGMPFIPCPEYRCTARGEILIPLYRY